MRSGKGFTGKRRMKGKKENKTVGAPSKLNEDVLSAIAKVVDEKILVCTDEELVIAVNELLPEDKQFTYEAFSKWKRGLSQVDNPLYPSFLRLIKKALVNEKSRLLKLLETDKNSWQRYAWILERKFDEWNIKNKSEIDHNVNIPQLPAIVIKTNPKID